MIEYIYDAIRATAGENITVNAKLTDDNGNEIIETQKEAVYTAWLNFMDDDSIIVAVGGDYSNGVWSFVIPGELTQGLKGRYWYTISALGHDLSFKQPLYLE